MDILSERLTRNTPGAGAARQPRGGEDGVLPTSLSPNTKPSQPQIDLRVHDIADKVADGVFRLVTEFIYIYIHVYMYIKIDIYIYILTQI